MTGRCGLGLALAALLALPAVAETPSAKDILNKSKLAMGGDAWDAVRTTYTKGKLATSGLNGTGESWEDNLTGRFVGRFQLGPVSGAQGFDGKEVWSQDSVPAVEGRFQQRLRGGERRRRGAEALQHRF
jgi:hypothetical protein